MRLLILLVCFLGCAEERAARVIWTADDGTSWEGSWYDSDLGAECSWWTAPSGETRCYPEALPALLFADSSCSTPIAEHFGTCGSTVPDFLTVFSTADCAPALYYRRGDVVHPSDIFRDTGTECRREAANPEATYYGLGEFVPLDELMRARPDR